MYGRLPDDIERDLRWNGCYNAAVAAKLIKKSIEHAGDDFWQGVARYEASDPTFLGRVISEIKVLTRKPKPR